MKHNSHSSPSEHVISEPNHQNMKKKIWEWFIMMIADGLDIVWCTAFNCVYMESINWGNLSFVSFNAWEWWSDPQTSEYYVAAPIFTRLTNKLPIYQYLQPHTASLLQNIFQFNIGESTQFYWPRFNAVNVGSSSRNRKLFRLLMFSGPAGPAQPFTVKIRISTRIQKFVHQNTVCKTRNFSCKVYYEVVPGYKYSSLS